MKARATIATTSCPRRLSWGCGPRTPDGWLNCDRIAAAGVDVPCDVLAGLPLGDASVDYVVAMHALQKLAYRDVVPALRELRRVLAPAGVLRLGVPDLERAFAAYACDDRGYFRVPDTDADSIGGKLVTQLIWYGTVRTPFTFDFAAEVLARAGFVDVVRCAFGETETPFPDIVTLDDRERETLFVEAMR